MFLGSEHVDSTGKELYQLREIIIHLEADDLEELARFLLHASRLKRSGELHAHNCIDIDELVPGWRDRQGVLVRVLGKEL